MRTFVRLCVVTMVALTALVAGAHLASAAAATADWSQASGGACIYTKAEQGKPSRLNCAKSPKCAMCNPGSAAAKASVHPPKPSHVSTPKGTTPTPNPKREHDGTWREATPDEMEELAQAIALLDANYAEKQAQFPDASFALAHDRDLAQLLGERGFLLEQWDVLQHVIAESYPVVDQQAMDDAQQIYIMSGDPLGAIEYNKYWQATLPAIEVTPSVIDPFTVDPYAAYRYSASIHNLDLAQAAGMTQLVPELSADVRLYEDNLSNSPPQVVQNVGQQAIELILGTAQP